MSISAYVGLPGHGKSYGVVENVILPALKNNRLVYTNIPMIDEKCHADFGCAVVPFATEDIVKNPNWFNDVFTAGAILVFDEVWRLWPAGLKANNVIEQHKTFLAEHRHMVGENGFSTEIYLVTQDLGQVASFARALVETTYRMVKRVSIGLDKRFRVDIYEGAVTGSKPPESKRIREIHGGKFSKSVYQYYKSHTKSQTGFAGNEERTDKRNNALGRTSIKLGVVFILIAIPAVYFGFKSVVNKYAPPKPEPLIQEQVITNPQKQSPSKPSSVQNTSTPIKQKPSMPEFLSVAKQFFISHRITHNGVLEIYFSISFKDTRATLTARDLQKLGYKLVPLNDCLIKVQGFDFSGYAMCNKGQPNTGFVQSVIAGTKNESI